MSRELSAAEARRMVEERRLAVVRAKLAYKERIGMRKHEGEEAFRALVTKLGMTHETLDGEVVLRALESDDLPRETRAAIVEYLIGEYIKPTDESVEIKIKAANWLGRLACENDLVSEESYRALVKQFHDLAKLEKPMHRERLEEIYEWCVSRRKLQ